MPLFLNWNKLLKPSAGPYCVNRTLPATEKETESQ